MKKEELPHSGMEEADRIAYLIAGFLRQTLKDEEHDELDAWIEASDANQRLFEELTDPAVTEEWLQEMDTINSEKELQRIKKGLLFRPTASPAKQKRRILLYWTVAAAVLAAGIFTWYRYMKGNGQTDEPIAMRDSIHPGGNYAVLTLADGRKVNLSEMQNGLIDSSSGSDVLKTGEGQLSYENPEGKMIAYHTLSTPVGGQYKVQLPDGSRVWLNSSSVLRYPVAFTGKERIVELKGEGYFEVNASARPSTNGGAGVMVPFIVQLNDHAAVEVKGTVFNINAYAEEPFIATTLVEGKVRAGDLRAGGEYKDLVPGQQAQTGQFGETDVVSGVHTDVVTAWVKGQFKFRDAPIEEIMQQVSRWYGAEVVYEGKVNYHFTATIQRSEPVQKLLDILSDTKRVGFRVEGKRIVVVGG